MTERDNNKTKHIEAEEKGLRTGEVEGGGGNSSKEAEEVKEEQIADNATDTATTKVGTAVVDTTAATTKGQDCGMGEEEANYAEGTEPRNEAGMGELFGIFFKIGTFTLGGGYAMIPLIQREVVDRKGWLKEEEFLNMIALAQAAPGIIAVNTAIFIGWQCARWKGLIGAVVGAVLPSFLIILAIALVFQDYKNEPSVEAVFKGIRPAVVALIAAPLWKMGKAAKINGIGAIVAISAALLIWLGGVSPAWIIFATILATMAYTYWQIKREKGK